MLAERKLVRVAVCKGAEADVSEGFCGFIRGDFGGDFDVLLGRAPAQQGWFLKNKGGAGCHIPRAGGWGQPREDAQECGFTDAGGACEGDNLALLDRQLDWAKNRGPPIGEPRQIKGGNGAGHSAGGV